MSEWSIPTDAETVSADKYISLLNTYHVEIKAVTELDRRLELMWAWMQDPTGEISEDFTYDHPEAADWFDKEGRVK